MQLSIDIFGLFQFKKKDRVLGMSRSVIVIAVWILYNPIPLM